MIETETATLRVVSSVSEIAPADWDACANPALPVPGAGSGAPVSGAAVAAPPGDCQERSAVAAVELPAYNPFLSHDFLWSLEESGTATRKTGWLGQHLVLDGSDGAPAAIFPCYLKSHSMGEYVFDHGWADAYERAGGRYYPKLQASVPFTPVTGRRLLIRPGPDVDRVAAVLASGSVTLVRRLGVSSLHVTFATQEEWALLGAHGFLQRTDQQFHFLNEGYRDFEDFLSALASRKRKAIRRERRDALADGIEVEQLTGKA